MKTANFDYHLPPELVAQEPESRRENSRLFVWEANGDKRHLRFSQILDDLKAGDVIVLNNTKVLPAKMTGLRALRA